jgi:hypothetical protein
LGVCADKNTSRATTSSVARRCAPASTRAHDPRPEQRFFEQPEKLQRGQLGVGYSQIARRASVPQP